jgi:hypothetical protein
MQINNNTKRRQQQDLPDEIEEDIETKRDLELEKVEEVPLDMDNNAVNS